MDLEYLKVHAYINVVIWSTYRIYVSILDFQKKDISKISTVQLRFAGVFIKWCEAHKPKFSEISSREAPLQEKWVKTILDFGATITGVTTTFVSVIIRRSRQQMLVQSQSLYA